MEDQDIIKLIEIECFSSSGNDKRRQEIVLSGKGVKVSRDAGEVSVDVYCDVRYGESIPALAWNMQNKIKDILETKLDEGVKSVNINIQGVKR